MGRVIARNVVKRRAGHLYYIDAKGNVCEAKMARGGRRKRKTTTTKRKTTARRTTARRTTTKRTTTRRRR
ncbi:MAG: hypothetical protein IIA87_04550 [Nanoarchaeota archaeon]|nr:hypothetical protein [Nanoarchaeota archaeon]